MRTGLLTVEWRVTRAADVTLVTAHVTNTHDTAREVRLENRLDGPVLPPCRHGVAEAGWDDEGLTHQVPGESRVSVGYACRASPETPPVDVTDRPVGETGEGDGTTLVDRALRSLGDHAPPPAVVSSKRGLPLDDPPQVSESAASASSPVGATRPADSLRGMRVGSDCDSATENERERAAEPEREGETGTQHETGTNAVAATADDVSRSTPSPDPHTTGSSAPSSDSAAPTSSESSTESVPAPVAAWFDAVEARLTTADRLAGDVAEATPVVASLGGRAGVEILATTLDADAAALARVAARADELAARAESTEVPDLGGPR